MPSDAPNTSSGTSGTGGEGLTVAQAAARIEGLLGPSTDDKPKTSNAAPSDDGGSSADDAADQSDAATQPANDDTAADDQPPADDAAAEPDPATAAPVEVELSLPDGTTQKVKLDELKNGYLRHSDYTRKTQGLAEKEKAFDAHIQQQAEAFKQGLGTLRAELERLIPSEASIDWEALKARDRANNTTEYVDTKEFFRDLKDKRQTVLQQQAAIAQQEQERTQRQTVETLKAESEALAKALPVFADPKKADAAKGELRNYLLKAGYTPEQIAGLSDHRSVTIAWKAAQYDKAQAAKLPIEKRVVGLPRVVKPGAAVDGEHVSRQKLTALDQKLRKTGRVEDAAALILARMN